MKKIAAVVSLASVLAAPVMAQDVDAREISGLVETYKVLHAHPELSHHEEHTAALLAGELRKAGYSVTERVGRYPDGTQAYGVVALLDAQSTPAMYNDPPLTVRVKAALTQALGAANVIDEEPGTASEDFGVLGLEDLRIPTMMFGLGAVDPEKFNAAAAAGKLVPGPHNSRFEPEPEPTLRTGVTAMSSVAIALLQ